MKDNSFEVFRDKMLSLDVVAWAEHYLTLDGKPFRIHSNGYRPFADIYRYIAIKSLEPDALPTLLVKGRQVGGTVMATVLELYFVGCGLFGTNGKAPIRIIHAFPQKEIAEKFSKEKLNPMINSSLTIGESNRGQVKSYMQNLLDRSSDTGDSLKFKSFINGNFIRVDNTGLDGGRLRGGTADVMFFDECFPFDQCIETENGKSKIGNIYTDFVSGKSVSRVKTFNETTEQFEYKKVINAWKRGERELLQITCGNREIKCTPNHRFLTESGWVRADCLTPGDLLKTSIGTDLHIRALNSDQMQIALGSFLGDGHLDNFKNGRYRLSESHGIKQRGYCEWKASIFNAKITVIEKNGFSQKPAIRFSSKIFGLRKTLPMNKKFCPQWVLDNLDARGLAIWFMDDGSTQKWGKKIQGASGYFSTCSFDEESHVRIVQKFESLGIKCSYRKEKDGYHYLFFKKEGFVHLFNIIRPYMHRDLNYKITNPYEEGDKYKWSKSFKSYGFTVVDKITVLTRQEVVYDIEVEDNHNFILAPCYRSKNVGGPIVHNCQDIPSEALGNTVEMLKQAKHGRVPGGVQVYFGTPKRKGSDFYKMWNVSSQQYFYLGCEKCKKHFPLYTPGSNDWEKIWIHGFTVKCTHCNHEQDKRIAAERGKWVSTKDPNDPEVRYISFLINQLYMPNISREAIESERPGIHPTNTERKFQNEVLGEFFQGDSSPITAEEIIKECGERDRGIRARIKPGEEQMVVLGIDYGAKSDLESLADPNRTHSGMSYTTAVVMSVKGPNLFSIDLALKFPKNDPTSKKGLIDQIMRQYSVDIAVGDIGYSNDISHDLHTVYGDRYLVSRAHNRINDKIKFNADAYPKEIVFERDYFIGEIFELLKKGQIKFPLKDYDRIAWMIEQCASMELKPSISRTGGDPEIHYVKSGMCGNDSLMSILNCYLAYKYFITGGFKIKNPNLMNKAVDKNKGKPLAIIGSFGLGRNRNM